ncbi:MAG: MbnP family protein [Saprospiraceae bacterium]
MKIKPLFAPFLRLLSLVLAFSACYEPREGCLDIEATNFDAAADDNCCCTYPALLLTFQPRFDTQVWKPDTAYQLEPGKWFRIHQAVFYLSDFRLVQNGAGLQVSDTLGLSVFGTGGDTLRTVFTNDFLLVRRTTANYTVGTFRPAGAFESVHFRVGVPDAAQRVIPGLTPEGHPLGLQNEGLWLGPDTGFVALKLVVSRDTLAATVPDTLLFSQPDFAPVLVQTNGAFQHESGYDFSFKLVADFRELFSGVDLSNTDIPAWKARIVANLPKALRVSQ